MLASLCVNDVLGLISLHYLGCVCGTRELFGCVSWQAGLEPGVDRGPHQAAGLRGGS